jgi:hypothetical protein
LSEAQMCALLAASYPLPPAGPFGEVCFRGNGERGDFIPSGSCLIAQQITSVKSCQNYAANIHAQIA